VFVDLRDGAAVVREAEVLTALSVVSPGGTVSPDALGGLGRPDGSHVWLSVAELRFAAAATVAEQDRADWLKGFDGMIAYATSKGWTDESGTHVRAHVEEDR
jgi:hypothetical protein